MNLIQSIRRISQKLGAWHEAMAHQDAQLPLIKKLYLKNGLELKMTCPACPEQYEVFKGGQQVAYFRLRHGEFRIDCPDHTGETIYECWPNGDGIFDEDERFLVLTTSMRTLLSRLNR